MEMCHNGGHIATFAVQRRRVPGPRIEVLNQIACDAAVDIQRPYKGIGKRQGRIGSFRRHRSSETEKQGSRGSQSITGFARAWMRPFGASTGPLRTRNWVLVELAR